MLSRISRVNVLSERSGLRICVRFLAKLGCCCMWLAVAANRSWGQSIEFQFLNDPDLQIVGNVAIVNGTEWEDLVRVQSAPEFGDYIRIQILDLDEVIVLEDLFYVPNFEAVIVHLGGGADSYVNSTNCREIVYCGTGGDVVIHADPYNTVWGGVGNDTITANVAYGGDGNDTITGTSADDFLYGDEGNDVVHGGLNQDFIYGGVGHDALRGDDGDDNIWGELGNDLMEGGGGLDNLYGGPEDDLLRGGDGPDQLVGDQGADDLYGGAGSDTLIGGTTGSDGSRDDLWGEAGADTFAKNGLKRPAEDHRHDFNQNEGDVLFNP